MASVCCQQAIVDRMDKGEWRAHPTINKEILDLVAPSYVDATELLRREFARNDVLYCLRDQDGRLLTFFMVGGGSLSVDGEEVPTVWLGLSATSQATKGSGLVRRVYRAFIDDAIAWQQTLGRQLVLWATTATPSVYQAASLLFADLEPHSDRDYSSDAARIAECLRRAHGYPTAGPEDNPFVLRGVATGTRYSPAEVARLRAVRHHAGVDLLERLGVDEQNGDRLLLICRLSHVLAVPRHVKAATGTRGADVRRSA